MPSEKPIENGRGTRVRHAPHPVVATLLGLGLVYLAVLAVFALAFDPPPASGWAGFAVVVVVVLAITGVAGGVLAGRERR